LSAREEALPYYKWLWRDFRSNRKVQRMGYIAKGLYRELIDEAWTEGSIANDMEELADICGCPVEVMTEAWPRIEVCWRLDGDRWVNDKLESMRTAVDAIRVTKSRAGRLGGLTKLKNALEIEAADVSKVEQKLADAKHVLAPATECHIAEHKQEQKQSKSKEKPSGKPEADFRHHRFHEQIDRYWKHKTGEDKAPWDGSEGKALSQLLAAKPDLTIDQFRVMLKHRGDSPAEVQTERPRQWLPNILRFAGGPLDRYGKPLNAPSKPEQRSVTWEEALAR